MTTGSGEANLSQRIDDAFDAVLDLPAGEWEGYLASLLASDPEVHGEVRALLNAHARTEGVLEADAMEAVASAAEKALESIRIGPYRTIRELGRGGMALVYLAERADGHFERQVAIKVIRGRPDALELHRRFLAERQILASLDHSGIARLLDGGLSPGGIPYLVMEYVDGLPITEYCDARRLSVDARLRLFREVCDVVHYAHQNLIIHRDLKPTNIMVTNDGQVKLLDFGIAKLLDPAQTAAPVTRTDHRMMTPEYASPEQVQGLSLTTTSDVYGLGIVLYELLCGHRPYRLAQKSAAQVLRLVCEQDPERPSTRVPQQETLPQGDGTTREVGPRQVAGTRGVPPERLRRSLKGDLDNIVMAALRKEPGRRYGSAQLLGQDIHRFLAGLPVLAHRGSTLYRSLKFLRRNRAQSAAALLAAASLLVGSTAAVWQGRVAARERDRAEAALRQSLEVKDFLISLFEANDPMEARGAAPTAGDLLARGVDRIDALEGQPEVQAEMLDAVGRVYQSLGRFDEARPYLSRSLALRRGVFGDTDAVVAESLERMGTILRLTGDYGESERHFRESLALRRDLLGPDDPRIAAGLSALSDLLRTVGAYAEAEPLAQEALEIWQRTQAPPDPALATGMRNLGWIKHLRGDDVGAEVLYRQALTMRRELVGDGHPDVASVQILLADLLLSRDDWEGAQPLYAAALAVRRSFMGDRHPYTASTINNLGLVAQAKGDFVRAEELHRQALGIWREVLGDDHAYIAWGTNDLSTALWAQGRAQEADSLQREALAMRRLLLGDTHPDVALSLHNLGIMAASRGELEQASELLGQALTRRRNALGDRHPDLVETLTELAAVEHELGRDESAAGLLEEALALARDRLGDEHARTRVIQADLARISPPRTGAGE